MENAVLCPTCEDVTGHQILRQKEIGRGMNICYDVKNAQPFMNYNSATSIEESTFMLTDGPNSYMATIDLDADEWLENNDVFEHDEMAWRITRLETEDGVVEAIEASNLIRAVALRQDMHRVKITKARRYFHT